MNGILSRIIVFLLFSGAAQAMQNTDFERNKLSPKGRMAYDQLSSTCIFGVGGVGYAAEISKEELALYDLLDEPHAIEALKSLVAAGSYEGALYGLLGLSLRNNLEFNRAVEIYKARKERPEWQTTSSFKCFRATGETISIQSGCIISTELRAKVVTDIQSGRYDKLITGKSSFRQPQR